MQSISKKNLEKILKKVARDYDISDKDMLSLSNTVFSVFLSKMFQINNLETINMKGLGRIYPGPNVIRIKKSLIDLTERLDTRFKEENIIYDYQ